MLFDAHTHIFHEDQVRGRALLAATDAGFARIYRDDHAAMATAEDLLATMDRDGVGRAVAAGFAFAEPDQLALQAEALLAAAAQHPGRVVPLPCLNLAHADWLAAAAGLAARGARGFGELRPGDQGWDPLGPASRALCDFAGAHGLVLLWHVSEPVGHAYPGKEGGISPADLCRLAEVHPDVRMVAAHLGGGLSFYLQMPEMRLALRNLYFDTAAASLLYDEQSIARLVALAGPGRVLFGSDYPLLSPGRHARRTGAALASPDAKAVLGGTAETLFPDKRLE